MLTTGDSINVPVGIKNLNGFRLENVTMTIRQKAGEGSTVSKTVRVEEGVGAGENLVKEVVVEAGEVGEGQFMEVEVEGYGKDKEVYRDKVVQYTTVLPKGFPKSKSFGGFIGSHLNQSSSTPSSASMLFTIPSTLEPNTLHISGKLLSSNYASLLEAVEALIKDPYGCFEQTSATTYPMVMAL